MLLSLAHSASLHGRDPEIPPSVFRAFADRVRKRSGIVLGPEKTALVQQRLLRVAKDKGYNSLSAYLHHIATTRSEVDLKDAVDRLTTNHTYFWRESDHFSLFEKEVLPEMKDVLSRPGPTRVWCAASSTGQEPWTLAGVMQDVAPCAFSRRAITATDLSAEVVKAAERGIYPRRDVERMPVGQRSRWFRVKGDGFSVAPSLRREVDYRVLNLMDASYPWHGTLHVVFCRNVLIYFDDKTRLAVIDRIQRTLRKDGWLFLSQTEALPREAKGWRRIGAGVWRKL